jgi:hypothetical protein
VKVNFSQVLIDLEGSPIVDNGKPVTLGAITAQALLAADPNTPESGDDKARAYDIATRVYRAGEVEVSVEDVALMKKKIGQFMTAIVVGQTFRMLEQG